MRIRSTSCTLSIQSASRRASPCPFSDASMRKRTASRRAAASALKRGGATGKGVSRSPAAQSRALSARRLKFRSAARKKPVARIRLPMRFAAEASMV